MVPESVLVHVTPLQATPLRPHAISVLTIVIMRNGIIAEQKNIFTRFALLPRSSLAVQKN